MEMDGSALCQYAHATARPLISLATYFGLVSSVRGSRGSRSSASPSSRGTRLRGRNHFQGHRQQRSPDGSGQTVQPHPHDPLLVRRLRHSEWHNRPVSDSSYLLGCPWKRTILLRPFLKRSITQPAYLSPHSRQCPQWAAMPPRRL